MFIFFFVNGNFKNCTQIFIDAVLFLQNVSSKREQKHTDFANALKFLKITRVRARAAGASKMEPFVVIVNGKPLTVITKSSILDVAAALDPPLNIIFDTEQVENIKSTKR